MNEPIDYERRQRTDDIVGCAVFVCMAILTALGLLAGMLIGWGVWG